MNYGTEWVYYGAGMIYLKNQLYKEARHEFNRTLKCNPSLGNAYAQLGIICKIEGRKDEAKAFFEKAISYDPENEIAEFQFGLLHMGNGNYDAAADMFSKAIESNPSHTGAMMNLGIAYGRKGEFDTAIKLIDDAYYKDQTLKDGFARLGWAKAEAQDWSGALDLMDKDRQWDRLSPPWQVKLAQAYGRSGDFETAVVLIEQAYNQSKSLKDGYGNLGWIKTEFQDWPGAFGLLLKDYERGRMSPRGQINLAMIQVFNGEHDDAVKLIDELYSQDEDAVDGYAILGWARYLFSGNEQSLQFFIEKDAGLNRLSVNGVKLKAMAMSMRGEINSACMLVDSFYSKDLLLKDGFAAMGWLLIAKGYSKKGLALIEKDYRLKRLSPVWQINYAYQLAKLGHYQKARILFNEVMEMEPHRQLFRIGYQLKPHRIMSRRDIKEMMNSAA